MDVWFHVEKSDGAGITRNMHHNLGRFEQIGNQPVNRVAAPVERSGWDKETAEALLLSLVGDLKCNFSFPRGVGENTEPYWFDIRPDVVQNITGWVPGTVLTLHVSGLTAPYFHRPRHKSRKRRT